MLSAEHSTNVPHRFAFGQTGDNLLFLLRKLGCQAAEND
jgi:hypothetical protein